MERKDSTKSQVSEHTIKVYSNLSCCIHADVNKRQITGGKNNSKIEEKGGGKIPLMINLRFGARAQPLIPKSERKLNMSTADELYSHLPPFRITTVSLLTFT